MSLFEDLKPFLQVAKIFGFAPYSTNGVDVALSRKSIIYSGFCTIFYGYLFYMRLDVLTSTDVEIKLRLLTILRTTLSECTIFVDIFVSIRCHDKLRASLEFMQRYDQAVKLEATPRINALRCWIVIGAIAVYFLILGWLTYFYETRRPLESSILYIALYASTTFGILKFSAIAVSLLRRFRHLNRMLKAGWSRRQLNLRDAWSLHGCLVAAAEELNSLYSAQLLLWIAGLTFNSISRIYVFCEIDGFINFMKVFREGGIALAFIFLLTVLAAVCHMTAAEANKVGSIAFSPVSSIFRRRRNSEIEESIQIGLYFLFHRFNFSAALGFVQVDLPLLQTIVNRTLKSILHKLIAGTMTTYLVILKAPG